MYPNPNERIVRRKETRQITGVSERSQRELEATGEFPLPYKISPRAVGHKLSELLEWIESRPLDSGERLSAKKQAARKKLQREAQGAA